MIRIVTDSTCDIPFSKWDEMGIEVLPLTIDFSGKVYKDALDLTTTRFYEKLRAAKELPKTSQVNAGECRALFQKLTKNNDDEIVGIFVSSELSGTVQSAHIAANEVAPGRIFVVDSRTLSIGMALLIKEAIKVRDEGNISAEDIARRIQTLAMRTRIFAVLDTLKYLHMSGRLSGGKAIIGEILGIKPLIQLWGGRIETVCKVRGDRAAMKAMLEDIRKYHPDYSYGIAFGHADARGRMDAYIKFLRPLFPKSTPYVGDVGCVVGTHSGPGTVAVAYIAEKE